MLIALTGPGQADDRAKTKAAGFDHHLVKPADPTDVERPQKAASLKWDPDE